MGLLGDGWSDPQSAAVMNLAGGLLQGNFGAGLIGANNGYQDARMKGLQAQDVAQQIQMRNIQLQQAQQQWQLQQPLLAKLVSGLSGGGGMGAQSTQPAQPATQPTPGGAMGSGTFGIPTGGQQAAMPQTQGAQGGPMLPGVPDNLTRWAIATGGIGAVPGLLEKFNQPTDFQKLLSAAGIDSSSPQGQAFIAQQIKKQNNIPLQAGRAGAPMYGPDGQIVAMAPKIPDNAIPQIENGRVVGVSPLPGGANISQINSYAENAGKAQTKPITAFRNGQPVFTNELSAAQGGAPSMPGPVEEGKAQFALMMQERAKAVQAGDAQSVASIDREIARLPAASRVALNADGLAVPQSGSLAPQLPPGYALGQDNAQNTLDKRWQALATANSEAQNTKSYLDSIKQLASKAAVGPFTDKLQFTNALLAMVGNEKATDATTANNLLDKYSGQIVSRLGGSGGLATDAARSILQSAYPNAHMTAQAIQEAADNIGGAQSMVQAKAALLQQSATQRDPASYTKKELTFDQNADPRLWQLKNMDPATAQKWLSSQPPGVQADLRKRAANLKMMGVF